MTKSSHTRGAAFCLVTAVFLLCIVSESAGAQDSAADREAFRDILAEIYPQDGAGAAVVVMQNGALVFADAVGMAHLELAVPLQPDMVFRIGSLTKQFTATAIYMLAGEKKIDLESRITDYLPSFPERGITVRHLLTHSAGLPEYSNYEWWNERVDATLQEIVDYFKDEPLDFVPGTQASYSNSNYILLAQLIEKVTEQSYGDYLEKTLFVPFGLTHTSSGREPGIIPGRVTGYTRRDGQIQRAGFISMSQTVGAGSVSSSPLDLARWADLLVRGSVLDQEQLRAMFAPCVTTDGHVTDYASGWRISELEGYRVIHHPGFMLGFASELMLVPEKKLSVIVISNSFAPMSGPRTAARQMLQLLLDR